MIVPLYDEEAGIDALGAAWRAFRDQFGGRRTLALVLVDDGSTDATGTRLTRVFADVSGVTIRTHEANRGLCAALATGLEATPEGCLVGWLDADLTYDPAILAELADALEAEAADVAIASCYHPDGHVDGVPAWRRALSAGASTLYRLVATRRIHTYTSMVRVYRRDVLVACTPRAPGFLGVTETLLRALRRGARVVERPATLARRRTGQSKIRVARVAFGHVGLVAAWLLRRL